MCYSYGSIDQSANPCPMCKVFPTARCPHTRDVCRNRAMHPRMNVLFLNNAEVDSFNGCGFCKWANHDDKARGYNNPGWPGCCRAPTPEEYHLIQAADWKAVSIVHGVPIPPQIKTFLDAFSAKLPPSSSSSPASRTLSKASNATPSRKNSNASTPTRPPVVATKAISTPPATLRGRSPQTSHPPSTNISRSSSSTRISSSVPSPSTLDYTRPRKAPSDRRVEGTHSSNSSPSRKSVDLENPTSPRRSSTVRRPTVTPATTSVQVSKVDASSTRQASSSVRRRASVNAAGPVPPSSSTSTPSSSSRPTASSVFATPRKASRDDDCGASTSSGSSDGLGSLSDSTITSEGFTDYLSDESEAELQRQAEAKAAMLAQMQAEELEFKMARQQLATVDLRPPKTWNPPSPTNGQSSALRNSSRNANVPQSFAAAATVIAQSASARG